MPDFTHPDNFTDLWAYVSWQIMKGGGSPLPRRFALAATPAKAMRAERLRSHLRAQPCPMLLKRDLGEGRMPLSRLRGDSKAAEGARGGGHGRGAAAASSRATFALPQPQPRSVRSAAHTKKPPLDLRG